MRKTIPVIATLFACAFTVAASAQSAFIERKQVSPATARKLVDACIARAEQQKQMVGCAVVEPACSSISTAGTRSKDQRDANRLCRISITSIRSSCIVIFDALLAANFFKSGSPPTRA